MSYYYYYYYSKGSMDFTPPFKGGWNRGHQLGKILLLLLDLGIDLGVVSIHPRKKCINLILY